MLLRARLGEPSRHLGTVFVRLKRASAHLLFLNGLFMIRHIKDYAMAAINGTLAPRGHTHFRPHR